MGRFDPAIRRAFLAAVVVWAALLFVAPPLTHAGTALANSLALTVYASASAICHQRPERSFYLLGVQMPVCARCTGIYVGAAVAAMALAIASIRRQTRLPSWAIALVSTVPSLATLVYEWTTGDMPSNWIRAVSGAPMGAVVSWLVINHSGGPRLPGSSVEGRVN
jgi:uncharacterized membrane protein